MSELSNQLNYLQSNRATLTIHGLNELSLTITEFQIPTITLPLAPQHTPFVEKPLAGDRLEFEPLSVTFLMQENLQNWIEIFNWMRGLGGAKDKDEYKNKPLLFTEATMIVYTNKNNPFLKLKFVDCVPISLGTIDFTEEDSETVYKKGTLELAYQRYDLKVL